MNIKIKAAHEAVRKTSKALKVIPKVNNEVVASSTTTITATTTLTATSAATIIN